MAPLQYVPMLKRMVQIAVLRNEINSISAAIILKRFGYPEGEATLKAFRVSDKTTDELNRIVKIKRTKLQMIEAKEKDAQGEQAEQDFFQLKARYSKIFGQWIPKDILLIEWCGVVEELRAMASATPQK
jgi:hypothetical protein